MIASIAKAADLARDRMRRTRHELGYSLIRRRRSFGMREVILWGGRAKRAC